jgi:hypothetical protein
MMFRTRAALPLIPALICSLTLVSCGTATSSRSEPAIGEAYAGPIQLVLRTDIGGRSAAAATVNHGDRLEVLENRRRFVRVRTAEGIEGWTDANLLLNSDQMKQLAGLSERAQQLPSQGKATVFDALNMHPEPNRTSPSFYQIPEEGAVEVVAHKVTPRVQAKPVTRSPPTKKELPKKPKGKAKQQVEPLLAPTSPRLPKDWIGLSVPRAADLAAESSSSSDAPPVLEDWSLVRAQDGKAGWVLSRMLFMAIPDEVAQYAEGHRITAYLALGEVKDGDQVKKTWMWATASPGYRASEFDGVRVFVWNAKKHRYETGYLERNMTGYYPVELASISGEPQNGFTLLAKDKDGKVYKRTYGFTGFRVKLLSKAPAELPKDLSTPEYGQFTTSSMPSVSQSWWSRLTEWARRRFQR